MIDEHTQQRLRKQYNPDGSQLRLLQLQILDILKEFDAICKKHNIPYWLDSGTLMGAVRHGGFIPWDDDIDVCVLKKDQKRLRNIMRKELREPFLYLDEKVDSAYPRKWARIVKEDKEKASKSNTIWMDIFFMENGNKTLFNIVNNTYGKCYRRRKRLVEANLLERTAAFLIYPFGWFIMQLARIIGRCMFGNTLVFDYGGVFTSIRKMDEIFPLAQIDFEGSSFNAPKSWDSYLRRIYNDYTKIPAEHLRHAHNDHIQIK